MQILFKELGKFKKEVFIVVFLSIVSALSMMGIPTVMQKLIDVAIPQKDFSVIFTVAGRMLILITIIIVSGVINSRFSSYVAMGIGKDMRSQVFAKVQGFSQEQIDAFSTSSLISRTNSDINQVQLFMSGCLRIAIMAPILCIVGIMMSLITSPRLSVVLIISVPILAIIITIVGKTAIPYSELMQTKLDKINMIIREKLTGVRVIRAFGTKEFEDERFDKENISYTETNVKTLFLTNLIRPIVDVVLGGTIIAVMILAVYNVKNGHSHYTTGNLMAMIQYIMLIMVAVLLVTVVFLLLPKTTICAKRAMDVIDSVSLIKDPEKPITPPPELKGYVEFKNVTFSYRGASIPAIKDLSFTSSPGETTAIIGGTGMGKSTIVNLIPRLYDATYGEVLVDGVNVKDYKLTDLRAKIGMVPQKALLFKGTIDNNISFGGDNPDEDRIEEACDIAMSTDFIKKKEEGFESPVAEGGTNFSGGQKQRLCIARAIVRKPEIYIFDDSFSALDLKTDKALRAALKKETGTNATTIIIAQRVSTIIDADRIIVVENGEVAGIGTHEELMGTCDVYKEIVASQMSKEEMNR